MVEEWCTDKLVGSPQSDRSCSTTASALTVNGFMLCIHVDVLELQMIECYVLAYI